MLNKILLIGRCGADPELRYTSQGNAVVNISLAVREGYGDKARTDWYKVVVWGKQAEFCGDNVKKGDLIYVEGSLKINPLEVIAFRVLSLTPKKKEVEPTKSESTETDQTEYEGDIPF